MTWDWQLGEAPTATPASSTAEPGLRRAVAVGESSGGPSSSSAGAASGGASGGGGGGEMDDLQARLDQLRRD